MEYLAFSGPNLLAQGPLDYLAVQLKSQLDAGHEESIFIFNKQDGRQVDIDLSGTLADVTRRYESGAEPVGEGDRKRRGRPRLGVVGREVTLLPRHWEWLDQQRNGASAQLRKLVDQARKAGAADDQVKQAQDSANRFMYALAGDERGFEEAVRALYARDKHGFERETAGWPEDVRDCARQLAELALLE